MKPSHSEPICLVSYELAQIRLGGGPDSRPSFWRVYREELELNRRTKFRNEHVRICRNVLRSLRQRVETPVYYRGNRLTTERVLPEHQPLFLE